MEVKTLQNILNTINSQIPHKPEFILFASKKVVDSIMKDNELIINYKDNYSVYKSLHYDIKIIVEPFLIGCQMYLYKDNQLCLWTDEDGKGYVVKK